MTFCQPTLQEQSRSVDRGMGVTVANSSLPWNKGGEGALKEPELKLRTKEQ